jgi:hypothetical protein
VSIACVDQITITIVPDKIGFLKGIQKFSKRRMKKNRSGILAIPIAQTMVMPALE